MTKSLKDLLRCYIASFFLKFAQMLGGLALRNFLGPAVYGIVSFLNTVQNHITYNAHLGIRPAIYRDIPILISKGREKEADYIKVQAFSFVILVSLLINFTLFIAAFLLKVDPNIVLGLKIYAIVNILMSVSSYGQIIVKAKKRFDIFATQNLIFGALYLFFVVSLTYFYGFNGFLAGLFLTHLFLALYMFFKAGLDFTWRIDFKKIRDLLSLGFPLLFSSIVLVNLQSIDKFMITGFLGLEKLGYYSVGIFIFALIMSLPIVLFDFLYPRFMESYGKNGNILDVKDILYKSTIFVALLFPFVTGFCYLVLPLIIKYLLPQYAEGLISAKIMVLAAFFAVIPLMFQNVLIALKMRRKLVEVGIIAFLAAVLLDFSFIKLGWGIEGIALATLIAYFIYSLLVIFTVAGKLDYKTFSQKLKIIFQLFPANLCGFLVAVIIGAFIRVFDHDILNFFAQYFLYLLLYSLVIYLIYTKTQVVKDILVLAKQQISPNYKKL